MDNDFLKKLNSVCENDPAFDNMVMAETLVKKITENLPIVETESTVQTFLGVRFITSRFIPENLVMLCAGENIVAVLDLRTGIVKKMELEPLVKPSPLYLPNEESGFRSYLWRKDLE